MLLQGEGGQLSIAEAAKNHQNWYFASLYLFFCNMGLGCILLGMT